MADFVVNEWLWSDLAGDNGRRNQRDALRFIEGFPKCDHRIIVIAASAFDQKAWGLCKSANPLVQRIAATYVLNVRVSDRCVALRPETLDPLPDNIAAIIKPDDHYLVQAQLAVTGSILATTDAPLRAAVAEAGLSCLSREEFLTRYF